MSTIHYRYPFKKIIIIAIALLLLITSIGTAYFFTRKQSFDGRGKAADPIVYNPRTAAIKNYTDELGPVLTHGETFSDFWNGQNNTPPQDGSIKTWSYYPDGKIIVTKGNVTWTLNAGATDWTRGDLKQKWSACNTFPADGVDAYSIHPGTSEEYAFKGLNLYVLTTSGQCKTNGQNMRDEWTKNASTLAGNHPLKNNSSIDQFQWLNADSQVYFTGNIMWLIGAQPANLQCDTSSTAWKFCEGETLQRRWIEKGKFENHPPLDKIGVVAISYKVPYQIYSFGNYVWTFGKDGISDTFRSGYDGYGARDPFIMKDGGKYYMYYDASDVYQTWKTAVAIADHPKGPWKKSGLVEFTGTIRPWEKDGCFCASTVFKHTDGKYYNFYLGAENYFGFFGAQGNSDHKHKVPGFDTRSNLPNGEARYYRLGLAVADNPLGPFKRLKGDGTLNASTFNDPPVLSKSTNPTPAKRSTGSAMGTLLQKDGKYYYSFPFGGQASGQSWGNGIAEAASILGPWKELDKPIIPATESAENSGIIYEPNSGYYFQFANALAPSAKWSQYSQCGKPSVGTVMYWSKDLFNWNTENFRMLATVSNQNCTKTDPSIDPRIRQKYSGSVGLGFPVLVPEENKIYVVYDGNDFFDPKPYASVNHMFRNIYLASVEVPQTNRNGNLGLNLSPTAPTGFSITRPVSTSNILPTNTSVPTKTVSPIPSTFPRGTITGIAEGSTISGQLNVLYAFSDDTSKVTKVNFYLNDILKFTDTTKLYEYKTTLIPGNYRLKVVITLNDGRKETKELNFTVAKNVNGLKGTYFHDINFATIAIERIDPQINFNWGTASPNPNIYPSTYAVRWTGKIQAPSTEEYTFYTRTDDGVRFWVNDLSNPLINDWKDKTVATEASGKIKLEKGKLYEIKLEYYEKYGSSSVELRWHTPTISKQLIPNAQLFAQ